MSKPTIVLLLSTSLLLGGSPLSYADDDGFWSWFSLARKKGVEPVSNALYNDECGACHFAYQPGLLPKASWEKLMGAQALADHFGENAELDDQTRLQLLDLLVKNAADDSSYKRSKKIMNSLQGDAPLRITEVPYFKHAHHEIGEDMYKGNPDVKSLSYCNRCHQEADKGIYDDDTVMIPGHGNWTW